ncbi:MAG: hypothetical protein LBN99_06835 [Oscillospiraceae bacterium]|jgi:hypothetical protein|nr:hypothetical protein [Oscillospiraceae bacterium]
MMRKAIKNLELMKIGGVGETHYGGSQAWYRSVWRREAGCGPTTVTCVVSYLSRRGSCAATDKTEFIELMNDVWGFVTPTIRGLPSTRHLTSGIRQYIAARDFPAAVAELEISGRATRRPAFEEVLSFIGDALDRDAPVAFLCLDHGAEDRLDDWHWTTLVSLEYGEGGDSGPSATVGILDGGRLFEVDIYKWYRTSSSGGGFVAII